MNEGRKGKKGIKTTPVTISDAAIRAISANAVRHLIEADQHFKAGRFPSATASAVLSIEEAGKVNYVTTHGSLPKTRRHAAHAMVFVALLKGLSSWDKTAAWTKVVIGGARPSDVEFSPQQKKDITDNAELADFVRRAEAGELKEPTERLNTWAAADAEREKRDGKFAFWDSLFKEGLQGIRLRATYVDIAQPGEVKTDPTSVDESAASFLCTGAVGYLALTLILANYSRNTLNLRDVAAALPDDITGWKSIYGTLHKVVPGFTDPDGAAREATSVGAIVNTLLTVVGV